MILLVQNDIQDNGQGLPKSSEESIGRIKDSLGILNEFRDPPKPATSGTQALLHSPLFLYSIYSTVFIVVAAIVLYWRFKNSS